VDDGEGDGARDAAAGQDAGADARPPGDGGGVDASAADASTDAGTAEPLSCDTLCSETFAACSGAVPASGPFQGEGGELQYTSLDVCKAACADYPRGEASAPAGDTLACRQRYAGLAADPAARAKYCPVTGVSGGGVCSDRATPGPDRCSTFCYLALKQCGPGPNQAYSNLSNCLGACGAAFKFDPAQAELTTAGNTLNCRQYHLMATFSDAAVHCPHIKPTSTACK